MELLECAAYLRAHDNYLLVTHQRPDGDTLGSASALCHALRRLGKTAHLYKNPEITEMFVPFISPYYAPEGFVPETCVSVDVAENKLLALGFEGKISLKLDHHVPRSSAASDVYKRQPRAFATPGRICRCSTRSFSAPSPRRG